MSSSHFIQLKSFHDHTPVFLGLKTFLRTTNWFFLFILFTTAVASIGKIDILGFNLSGWLWIIVIIVSLFVIVTHLIKSNFPILQWIPFFLYIALRTEFSDREEVQRFFILLTPVIAGYAASCLRSRRLSYVHIYSGAIYLFITLTLIYSIAVVQSNSFVPRTDWFALAGFCMTYVLIAIVFILSWVYYKNKIAIIILIACWFVVILSESRNPVLTIPLLYLFATWNNRNMWYSLIITAILSLIAVLLFQSAPIQENLFRQGQGNIDDLMLMDESVLKSGGRLSVWPAYLENIPDFWLGGGGTASAEFGRSLGWASHPHNEYIRVIFDYGVVGIFLLGWPFIALYAKLQKFYRRYNSQELKIFLAIPKLGLITILLLAMTGNVLLYVVWFGNLLFVIAGFALRQAREVKLRCR